MIFFLALITVTAGTLNKTELKGMSRLLKNLKEGAFTTCKIVFFSDQVTFDEADKNCKSFDIGAGQNKGNLATVNDAEKNGDLKLLLEMAYPWKEEKDKNKWGPTRWVWAGLRKTKNNNSPHAGKYDPDDWEWADGSKPHEFYKWLKNQPDQDAKKFGQDGCDESPQCFQNQMRINHEGKWDDTYKFKKHPYACDYQGKYILSNMNKTWNDAKRMCESAGLHLAKIRSAGEVEEMKMAIDYFLGKVDPTWRRFHNMNWIWVGGNDIEKEGDWKWLDGSAVDTNAAWFKWTHKAGNDNARNNQHGLAFSRKGEFDDSFINKRRARRGFACQCKGT